MPSDAYTEVIKEAFATARSDVAVIDTLEISHPAMLLQEKRMQIAFVFDRTHNSSSLGWFNERKQFLLNMLDCLEENNVICDVIIYTYYQVSEDMVDVTGGFVDINTAKTVAAGITRSYDTAANIIFGLSTFLAMNDACVNTQWSTNRKIKRFICPCLQRPSDQRMMTKQPVIDLMKNMDIGFVVGYGNFNRPDSAPNSAYFSEFISQLDGYWATTRGRRQPLDPPSVQTVDDVVEWMISAQNYPGQSPIYLVNDIVNHTFRDENGINRIFREAGFKIELPTRNDMGVQDLKISISNVNLEVSDFVQMASKMPNQPVEIIYRPYLSSDPNTPQLNPPLKLYLTEVSIDRFEVTGRATFANVLNRSAFNDKYTNTRFPAL